MLTLRLEDDLRDHLDTVADNKSEYVRSLIREDAKQSENRLNVLKRCLDSLPEFALRCSVRTPKGSRTAVDHLTEKPHSQVARALQDGEDVAVSKGRQVKASTTLAVYALWRAALDACSVRVLAPSQDVVCAFVDKVRFMHNSAPEWLVSPVVVSSRMEIAFQNGGRVSIAGNRENVHTVIADEFTFMDPSKKSAFCKNAFTSTQRVVTATGMPEKDSPIHGFEEDAETFRLPSRPEDFVGTEAERNEHCAPWLAE